MNKTNSQLKRKGIILAGGSGTRLYPITRPTSKQLLPVYDKPMVYYPLSLLMLAGIRDILLISDPQSLPNYERLLEDGSRLGLNISYAPQQKPAGLAEAFLIGESFLDGHPSALVLGDNLIYGQNLTELLQGVSERTQGATIFGYRVINPANYGVVEFDADGRILSLEEKPSKPKSSYAVPGLYFYDGSAVARARKLKPSARGELEITDLNRDYLKDGQLHLELFGRGSAWLDMGTFDDLLEAGNVVKVIQNRQGLKIACLEEIALFQKWITPAELDRSIQKMGSNSYSEYLKSLVAENRI
ncbi:MAG: glucose-1-phosphate thymidylyltransferase RfbA [Methylacidiphilales bacterium]|nr:glucose-1-phosphate thymidylyltransferase RfbA [Candidatus Methylacidiphilales bacterium]